MGNIDYSERFQDHDDEERQHTAVPLNTRYSTEGLVEGKQAGRTKTLHRQGLYVGTEAPRGESAHVSDQKAQLCLPRTSFPMRANLAEREPALLRQWQQEGLYQQILDKNRDAPSFTLHDGPPYPTGPIHYGHVLNKVLKDLVVRSRNMMGYHSRFVPGWDCHGLPIETQAVKNAQADQSKEASTSSQASPSAEMTLTPRALRDASRAYAQHYMTVQREEFERLGIMALWDEAYTTMSPHYEAETTKALAGLMRKEALEQRKKPVMWCTTCETALAEFEIQYRTRRTPSLFVSFPLISDPVNIDRNLRGRDVEVLIWTSRPWGLTANVAVAINPTLTYAAVRYQKKVYLMALDRVEHVVQACQWPAKSHNIVHTFQGTELLELECRHPFEHRRSPIIPATYVTRRTGTGCVHVAPGHDLRDYNLALTHKLDILTPVDQRGHLTAQVERFAGLSLAEADERIMRHLHSLGALLNPPHQETERVQAHCLRCDEQAILRATKQWFVPMDHKDLRQRALDAADKVLWYNPQAKQRLKENLQRRTDWCVSRQRPWGVPLSVFHCQRCHSPLVDPEHTEQLAQRYRDEGGSDLWFRKALEELLPSVPNGGTLRCETCGNSAFYKGQDTVDVWLESGLSHIAALPQQEAEAGPADLYLENIEQSRGWLQSSLLTSMQLHGRAPYKAVFTHSFVRAPALAEEEGAEAQRYTDTSTPSQPLPSLPGPHIRLQQGAELLRLWATQQDPARPFSPPNGETERSKRRYRKLRNTCRFMLGNLHDFDPAAHSPQVDALNALDRAALHDLRDFVRRCHHHYQRFAFHHLQQDFFDFCTHTLSKRYLEVCKDRLYVEASDSPTRRHAQYVIHQILDAVIRLMAPLLCFTAEELWQHMPKRENAPHSVHLSAMPTLADYPAAHDAHLAVSLLYPKRALLHRLYQQQPHLRKQVLSLQLYSSDDKHHGPLSTLTERELSPLFGVHSCHFHPAAAPPGEGRIQKEHGGFTLVVDPTPDVVCPRCRRHPVSQEGPGHQLCGRCVQVVNETPEQA